MPASWANGSVGYLRLALSPNGKIRWPIEPDRTPDAVPHRQRTYLQISSQCPGDRAARQWFLTYLILHLLPFVGLYVGGFSKKNTGRLTPPAKPA